MKKRGFELFVGVDGSDAMLEEAKESGLYQELKQCLLGEEAFPAEWGNNISVILPTSLIINYQYVCDEKEKNK